MIGFIKEHLLQFLSKKSTNNSEEPTTEPRIDNSRHLEILLGIYQPPVVPTNNSNKVPEQCRQCRYYFPGHQGQFVYCAVNPSGGEDCQDFYQRKS